MNINNLSKISAKIAVGALILMPFVASAQTTVQGILGTINGILNIVIPILMVLATVVFLWGVILYIVAGGDEEKLARAKSFIIAGLIGLFVMIAIWGLVRVLVTTFGVGGVGIPTQVGNV